MESKEIKRNPAYQFVSTNTNGIISDLIEGYELIMKSTVRPASPEMQLIRWVAHIIIQERMLNNWSANQNIPSRADGANLDALAELTYIQSRPPAKPAACKMRFEISQPQEQAILIPAGTRVTDSSNTLVWETLADHYIPAGQGARRRGSSATDTKPGRSTPWWMSTNIIPNAPIPTFRMAVPTCRQMRSITSL